MTNPPPVAPVEKHYALLQNGTVIRHLSRCEYNADIYRSPMIANCFWHSDGRCFVEHPSNGPEPWSHADIIATISPADMQAVASGELERLRAALNRIEGMDYINQISGNANFERAQIIARTALQGDAP